MKMVFHIGVHKTATTFLQRTLAINREALAAEGVRLARGVNPTGSNETEWEPFLSAFREFTRSHRHRWSLGKDLANRLRSYRVRAQSHGIERLLISEENLLGAPASWYLSRGHRTIGGRRPSFYPFSPHLARLMARVLGTESVTIIICTRQQHTLFRSLWLDGLFQLRLDLSLTEFLATLQRHGWKNYRFDTLVAPWQRQFGVDNVKLIPYESILESPVEYAGRFLTASGVHHEPAVPTDRVNESIDARKAATARLLSREVSRGANPRELSLAFREGRPPVTADWEEPVTINDELKARIREQFADDISYQLAARTRDDALRHDKEQWKH